MYLKNKGKNIQCTVSPYSIKFKGSIFHRLASQEFHQKLTNNSTHHCTDSYWRFYHSLC